MQLINKLKSVIYSSILAFVRLISATWIFKILVKIFRLTATTGTGSNQCLKEGFLPLPVHFYSPVPDINDLERRKIWDIRTEMIGIDFRDKSQADLLREIGTRYSDECQWPLLPTNNPADFYLQNQSFSYGCAASTHCVIRHFKPDSIIEIGSGMSSRVISRAAQMNRTATGCNINYMVVDPFPNPFIKNRSIEITELHENRVELLGFSFFNGLKENDILFIDSGHCVKIGGDVNYLFLEILPRLSPGVIIHIHDINMPYEYPKAYATSETFRQFWTEQYLLQSFLCFNSEFEVLMAMNYIMTDHSKSFREFFPHYNPEIHPFISGSFWIRRKV